MSRLPGLAKAAHPLVERVRAGTPVVGTFVKTTSPHVVEVLGQSGLDFVILDAEHAPFGIEALDRALGAATSVDLPALVRVPSHDAAFVNSCLDMGARGIVAPHVLSVSDALVLADAVKYGRGKRGFSPSGRAGRYGAPDPAAYREAADKGSMVWCQIEDREALERIDEIAAVDVIDCLFIGPADLGLSLGCSGADDPRLVQAVEAIAAAGRRHGRTIGLYVPTMERVAEMIPLGITVFLCGSDQSLLLGAARRIAAQLAPGAMA